MYPPSSGRDGRLLSRPYRVFWAGWETDTHSLQQCGWSIAAQWDMQHCGSRLALKHDASRVTALTDIVRDIDWENCQNPYARDGFPVFHVVTIATQIMVHTHETRAPQFKAIDAEPQVTMESVKSLDDMGIFQIPLTRTQEVYVEQADMDVIEHLEAIKRLQAPKQAELREQSLRHMRTEEGEYAPVDRPQQNVMAQIIELPKRRTA